MFLRLSRRQRPAVYRIRNRLYYLRTGRIAQVGGSVDDDRDALYNRSEKNPRFTDTSIEATHFRRPIRNPLVTVEEDSYGRLLYPI